MRRRAADSTACASSRRVPIFGATPITWIETLPISKPAARTRRRPRPAAPRRRRRPTPAGRCRSSPRGRPGPAAESSASQAAWAATSPSECPASPRSPAQSSPATQHGRPASKACTSVPTPTRGTITRARHGAAAAAPRRATRSTGRVIFKAARTPGTQCTGTPSCSTMPGVVGVRRRRAAACAVASTSRRKPCGVCTARSTARSTVPDDLAGVDLA